VQRNYVKNATPDGNLSENQAFSHILSGKSGVVSKKVRTFAAVAFGLVPKRHVPVCRKRGAALISPIRDTAIAMDDGLTFFYSFY